MNDTPAHHPVWDKDHPLWQRLRDLAQLLMVVGMAVTTWLGTRNSDRLGEVEQKQTVAAQKAETVRDVLEEKMDEDAKAQGVTLYSTWKYLEDVAAGSGSPRDKTKADEARRLYEAHLKRHNGRP